MSTPNPFDQFDAPQPAAGVIDRSGAPQAPATQAAPNPFDQFDPPPPAVVSPAVQAMADLAAQEGGVGAAPDVGGTEAGAGKDTRYDFLQGGGIGVNRIAAHIGHHLGLISDEHLAQIEKNATDQAYMNTTAGKVGSIAVPTAAALVAVPALAGEGATVAAGDALEAGMGAAGRFASSAYTPMANAAKAVTTKIAKSYLGKAALAGGAWETGRVVLHNLLGEENAKAVDKAVDIAKTAAGH